MSKLSIEELIEKLKNSENYEKLSEILKLFDFEKISEDSEIDVEKIKELLSNVKEEEINFELISEIASKLKNNNE